MADNVTVDNGTLTDYIVSSDEAASGQVQRVKIAYSADGLDTHVTADADGLLVNLGVNNDVSQAGTWTVQPGNTANTTAWLVTQRRGSSASVTAVADSATSGTLLASNSSRVTATITNDSSARLYVRYGAGAATTTDYTFSLAQHETVVVDDYSGQINGIWATDPNDGGARITEVT